MRVKRYILIIAVCILFACSIVYYVFHGLINMFLPFSDNIAKFIAERYVNENIPVETEQIGNADKNINDCLFEIDFVCSDNRDIFFSVYVDSNNFSIYNDTYKKVVFNNAVHNEMDSIFNEIFGNAAAYDVYFKIYEGNNSDIVYDDVKLSDINKYCEKINLYININYIENIDRDVYDKKASSFADNCSKHKLGINKVFLSYYSKSDVVPGLSYELDIKE